MNPIQKAIAKILRIPVPEQGKRAYAGARRDGASVSGWLTSGGSADSEIWNSLATLRQRSWDLYRNDPNVAGAINDIVSETVGQGILLQSKVKRRRGEGLDLKINHEIEEKFNLWADNPAWCDAAGKLTFWKMQKTILLSVLVSGEVLVRFVRQRFDDAPLPFALELIEADQLDDRLTLPARGNGNQIRMGVELNQWGRTVGYHILPSHPGDIWQGQSYQPQFVPASEILHIFNWRGYRPGQTRGVPALHSVILLARNLLGYQESEIVKARLQSCISAYFENELPDDMGLSEDEDGFFYKEMEPGIMEDLPPGKKLSVFDPSSPNPNLPEFVKAMQRGLARGLNTSSYLVSGDLADANYSSMRVGMLQQRKQFEMLRDDLNEDLNRKVFRQFMPLAVASNWLALPPDFGNSPDRYYQDHWVGEAWPWVDPGKDVSARKDELEMGTTTITRILAEKGIDIEEHFAELKQEQELRKKYGLEDAEEPDTADGEDEEDKEPVELGEGFTPTGRAYDPPEPEPLPVAVEPEPIPTPEPEPPPEPSNPTPQLSEEDEDDMPTTINININGIPMGQGQQPIYEADFDRSFTPPPDPEPWQDWLLMEGYTSTREYQERARKKKKAKKGKNCSKGQVCGMSCISKARTCLQNMTAKEFMAHNKAKREAKKAGKGGGGAAGALVEKGGALALLDKKQAEETIQRPRFEGDRQAEIDAKYASLNPTDKDIDNWTKETLENMAKPEGVETLTAQRALFEAFPVEKYTASYLGTVKDEQSFVEAFVALTAIEDGNRSIKIDGKNYTGKDIEYWRKLTEPYPDQKRKAEQARKVLDNPKKSDAQKAKAQKELDKYDKKLEEYEGYAQMHHRNFQRRGTDEAYVRELARESWAKESPSAREEASMASRRFNTKGPGGKDSREMGQEWLNETLERMVAPDHYFGTGADPYEAKRNRLMSYGQTNFLGTPKTRAELKQAFKAFAVENHPDKGGDTKMFQAVSAQYQNMLTYLN